MQLYFIISSSLFPPSSTLRRSNTEKIHSSLSFCHTQRTTDWLSLSYLWPALPAPTKTFLWPFQTILGTSPLNIGSPNGSIQVLFSEARYSPRVDCFKLMPSTDACLLTNLWVQISSLSSTRMSQRWPKSNVLKPVLILPHSLLPACSPSHSLPLLGNGNTNHHSQKLGVNH